VRPTMSDITDEKPTSSYALNYSRIMFPIGSTLMRHRESVSAPQNYCHRLQVPFQSGITLLPYDENPPDFTLPADDILSLDFGPVLEH
jgi:hypothetical protein